MKKHSLLLTTISLFAILLQGCGSSSEDSKAKVYPTAIGEGLSITTDEKNALMAPSVHALKEVGNNIGHILKTHITELNEKEAISFAKEMNYCDISGHKESTSTGTLQKLINNTHYLTCKSDESNQNGDIELTYEETDSEGKYPQVVTLRVKEAYSFNDIIFKKDLTVESTVLYNEDKSLKKISLKATGVVNFDYQTITLKDFESTKEP